MKVCRSGGRNIRNHRNHESIVALKSIISANCTVLHDGCTFLFRTTVGTDLTVPLKGILISANALLIRVDLSQYRTVQIATGLLLCVVASDTTVAVFLIR